MISAEFDSRELRELREGLAKRVLLRTTKKAGSTALRDMRSEASKRVRQRKRVKAKLVRKALIMRRPKGRADIDNLSWAIDVRGDTVPLSAYPHRQTKRGVSVAVNRGGSRTLVKSAFIATMGTGHRGVFVRRGAARLPIRELLGSRPVDALLHDGEAEGVQRRGRDSFARTFARLLPLEIDKAKG